MYFLYPETSGVRLEDMNVLFGDASTAMPTPATEGERGSLLGTSSPIPSLDIRRQPSQFGAESAIPGLDIDPPSFNNSRDEPGKSGDPGSHPGSQRGEGFSGWISNIVRRQRGPSNPSRYQRLGQGDERDEA